MNKNLLIPVLTMMLICIGLSGCITDDISGVQKQDNSKLGRFIGTWNTEQGVTLIFHSIEKCEFFGSSGTWEINNGTLFIVLVYTDGKNKMSFNYEFSDNDKTLTLTDAGDRVQVFSKQ